MESTQIQQQVRQFIEKNFGLAAQAGAVDNDTSFMDSGLLDSTGVLELVSFLEETYNIRVADEDLVPDNLDSINKVCAFVLRATASGN